jgi:hypothetical protein
MYQLFNYVRLLTFEEISIAKNSRELTNHDAGTCNPGVGGGSRGPLAEISNYEERSWSSSGCRNSWRIKKGVPINNYIIAVYISILCAICQIRENKGKYKVHCWYYVCINSTFELKNTKESAPNKTKLTTAHWTEYNPMVWGGSQGPSERIPGLWREERNCTHYSWWRR